MAVLLVGSNSITLMPDGVKLLLKGCVCSWGCWSVTVLRCQGRSIGQEDLLHPFLGEKDLAMVTSWLSYFTLLYMGLPLKTAWKPVQNAAASLLTGADQTDPGVQGSHRLPMPFCAQLMVLVTASKALYGLDQGSLKEHLLHFAPASLSLGSAIDQSLTSMVTRQRAFSCCFTFVVRLLEQRHKGLWKG